MVNRKDLSNIRYIPVIDSTVSSFPGKKCVGPVRMIEGLIYEVQRSEMWVLQVYKISSQIKPQHCGDKSNSGVCT